MEYNVTTMPSGAVIKIGISNAEAEKVDKRVTLLGFRSLLTADEKKKLDHVLDEETIPIEYRKDISSMMVDFDKADYIDINDSSISTGLVTLQNLGVFTGARVAQIKQLLKPDGNPIDEVHRYDG